MEHPSTRQEEGTTRQTFSMARASTRTQSEFALVSKDEGMNEVALILMETWTRLNVI
jgi:hypothetical protein